jgi:hypothetical protein
MSDREYDRRNIVHKGRDLAVLFHYDSDHGAPWADDCWYNKLVRTAKGRNYSRHGSYPKQPGERALGKEGNHFFDWQSAIINGKKEGNVGGIDTFMKLTAELRRVPTRKQCVEAQVQWMFDHCNDWCNDEWHYIGIEVIDEETEERESLWGIESCCEDYIEEVIEELAEQVYLPSIRAQIKAA